MRTTIVLDADDELAIVGTNAALARVTFRSTDTRVPPPPPPPLDRDPNQPIREHGSRWWPRRRKPVTITIATGH